VIQIDTAVALIDDAEVIRRILLNIWAVGRHGPAKPLDHRVNRLPYRAFAD
jgi:hypothetical protein